jgi:hypothetical protein
LEDILKDNLNFVVVVMKGKKLTVVKEEWVVFSFLGVVLLVSALWLLWAEFG